MILMKYHNYGITSEPTQINGKGRTNETSSSLHLYFIIAKINPCFAFYILVNFSYLRTKEFIFGSDGYWPNVSNQVLST